MSESQPTPLERVEATGNLEALQRDPRKVIRSERFADLREVYGDKFENEELAILVKDLYRELETRYDISVPAEFVIDTDKEGNEVLASVVDRVEGKNLDEVEYTQELVGKVEKLYTSVAHYLFDKSKTDEYFLTDVNNTTQYMFGVRHGESEPSIHLIDIDVYFNQGRKKMYLVMEWLCRHMNGAERLCHSEFTAARSYIEQFIKEPLPENLSDVEKADIENNVANIEAFLNNQKFGIAPTTGMGAFSD